MTQAQLEVLARSNPLVAKRMKEGYYKDRMREAGEAMPPGRRRRARPAALPADAGPTTPPARKKPAASRSTPGSTRTRPGSSSGKMAGGSGTPSRKGGFLKGLLGGG